MHKWHQHMIRSCAAWQEMKGKAATTVSCAFEIMFGVPSRWAPSLLSSEPRAYPYHGPRIIGGEQKRVECVGLGIRTPGTGVNYIGIYLSLRMVSTTAVGAYD